MSPSLPFGHWEVDETELFRPDGVEDHAANSGADHLLVGLPKTCFATVVRIGIDEVDVVVLVECAVPSQRRASLRPRRMGDACPPLA